MSRTTPREFLLSVVVANPTASKERLLNIYLAGLAKNATLQMAVNKNSFYNLHTAVVAVQAPPEVKVKAKAVKAAVRKREVAKIAGTIAHGILMNERLSNGVKMKNATGAMIAKELTTASGRTSYLAQIAKRVGPHETVGAQLNETILESFKRKSQGKARLRLVASRAA